MFITLSSGTSFVVAGRLAPSKVYPMAHDSTGIASVESPYSVDATLSRLKAMIATKKLTLFAHIDHAAGARQAGLQMREAHVLIFGHAKAGTPLMVERPLLALDLPLKVLVWQDEAAKVWASFTTPAFLAERHAIPAELLKNISGVEPLIKEALTA
jgi:uncharacterized protein (DUF302 family)